jgi:hypothetical protein
VSKISKLGTLGEKIKQSGFGKLKQLAFLNFTVREDINLVLISLGLDKQDIEQIHVFVKQTQESGNLNIKIQSDNTTLLAFLKTNIGVFEEALISKYPNLFIELKT